MRSVLDTADLALVLETSAALQQQAAADAIKFLDGYEAREQKRAAEFSAAISDVRAAIDAAISVLARAA